MSNNSFYYNEFVDCIIKIFKKYNKEKYLYELNINKDLCILSTVFLEPNEHIKEHYLSWNDKLWIESTKYIRLGLLSFLYKNKASLYKIYTLLEEDEINQCILLEKYKNLYKDLMANKNLSSIQNYIIQENVELDEIERKKYYLILNIKNFKNPKFVAYLFDILTYKVFRQNIFKYLLNNLKKIQQDNTNNKISIDEITKIENECETMFIKDLDKLIENGFFYSLCNFIMFLDFGKNKQICVNTVFQKKINDYIKDVLEKSSKIHTYLDILIANNKDAEVVFRSDITIVTVSEDVTSKSELNYYINTKSSKFEEKYKNSNNILIEEIDFDKAYNEAFVKKNKIKYNKRDFLNRIIHILYLGVEYITLLPKNDLKSKLEYINQLVQNMFKTFYSEVDEEDEFSLKEIISDIKQNGIIKNNSEAIDNKEMLTEINIFINNFLKEILNNTEINETNLAYLKNIFKISIEKLNIYKLKTDVKDFNVFSELFEKIIENKDIFKILMVEILQEKHISNFINILERVTLFRLNVLCKKKIIEIMLSFVKQIINFIQINNEKEYLNNAKMMLFMGKILDKFYIIAKNFSQISEDNRNVKKVVKYNTLRK
jgi:hypothetical protein